MSTSVAGIKGKAFFHWARLLLLLAVFLASNRLLAENAEGAFTLSPFAGGQMSIFVGEEHLDGDYKWGLRAGYNFTPHIGVELVFGENNTVHDPGDTPCKLYQYGGDLLYYFRPEKRLVPYVAAGFGGFTVNYDRVLSDRKTAYFNFGGGLDYALTNWLSVRGDIRHTITLDRGDNLFEGTIGLRFQFGRR
jgi:OOP family OmpA-OmpF porin